MNQSHSVNSEENLADGGKTWDTPYDNKIRLGFMGISMVAAVFFLIYRRAPGFSPFR